MGIEKQGSRGGNYVGGFLQMFDWNVKSRKKLFSSKSDVPELSKQKKRCDGNLPMTRLQMMDVDEIAAGPSIRESSDYSYASSVTDEDYTGTKAPGVVARLMGLDSLPKSNMSELYSTLFDSQSLQDVYYRNKSREYFQDQMMHSGSLKNVPNWNNDMEPNSRKVIHRPLEKFQSEVLPPKSAKTISITHHKLLSPIKSSNFNPSKDAAHIMEAAARIIERGPQASKKTKLPLIGSSSAPLRIKDLREKVEASQKPSKVFEISQKKSESSAVTNLRGLEHSMNRSCNGSQDGTSMRVTPDSNESSVAVKNRAKSISLALQAKANVQKRERLNVYSSTSMNSQKEPCKLSPNQVFKSQSVTRKNTQKKPSLQNGSSVLRQNNQKQNCIVDRGKSPSKKGGKTLSGESSSSRQRNSSKLAGTSKASSRKIGSEVKGDKNEALSSRSERITSKKRSVDGTYHSEKTQADNSMQIDQTAKSIQSSTSTDRMSSCWDQEVISFTFTSPMRRSQSDSERSTEAGESCKIFSAGSQNKRSQLSSSGKSASKFSYIGHNVKGGDALSTLLEQKLKELARKVDFSPEKSGTELHDMVPGLVDMMSSTKQDANKATNAMSMHTDNQGVLEEMSTSGSSISQTRKLIDYRHPSPVSVLEYSSFANSWNSSDTGDSTSMGGSKQCSSIQAQESLDTCSLKTLLKIEDTELSDSASSISNETMSKMQKTTLNMTDSGSPRERELNYVKRILYNIEIMFQDYALGRTCEIINPDLFNQLESRKGNLNDGGVTSRMDRRVLFDCVSECLELRCRQYVGGGCELWAKGLSVVRRKDRLAEEVYKEISGWSAVGDSMIDEIVDKDMSSQHGRWLGFDIEAFELGTQIESRILNSLMDEVLADMLVL